MEKYNTTQDGRVFNLNSGKELKQHIDKYGYPRVNLCINSKTTQKQIHRLVAIKYVDNIYNKPQVNHKDGDKTNNNSNNLEWVTNQENRNHAVRLGLHKHQKLAVYKNGFLLGEFNSSKDVADNIGLDQSAVSKCANGKYKTTKGFVIKKIN